MKGNADIFTVKGVENDHAIFCPMHLQYISVILCFIFCFVCPLPGIYTLSHRFLVVFPLL